MDDNNSGILSQLGIIQSLKNLTQENLPEVLAKANPEAQAKIAEAYTALQHNPNDPKVQRAYEALINEVTQQYDDLINNKGLQVSKIVGENPYKTSKDLINDVKTNNRMSYFPTDSGYGSGDISDHPLLKSSKYLDADGKPMPANDLFRIVHDYYGHVEGQNKFGATGEERAYQQHKKMFSPEAQKALTTETRGQNSWVNYGPHGEANRLNPANTIYAEQKAGILPEWASNNLEDIANPKAARLKAIGKMVGKFAGPTAIGLGAALAESPEQAITDTLIPGGVQNLGEDDSEIIGEVKGYNDYKKSNAKKDALKKLSN